MLYNRPNGHKISQHLPLQDPTKFTQIGIWENMPSGTPARESRHEPEGNDCVGDGPPDDERLGLVQGDFRHVGDAGREPQVGQRDLPSWFTDYI
jgi:hypothetical protein